MVVEGPVLVAEALAAGLRVEEVFVDPGAVDRGPVTAVVAEAVAAGAGAWVVTGGLRGHGATTTPNGAVAVVERPRSVDPAALVPRGALVDPAAFWLVLCGVGDPGNAGTLLRTAEAVGAGVVVGTGSVDVWAPKVVRASAGSIFRVTVTEGDPVPVLGDLAAAGVRTVGTRIASDPPPEAVDLSGPVAVVLGSEAHGLAPAVTAVVDTWTSLPMAGTVQSLNVAVAGSVLAFETTRQRRAVARVRR